MSDLEILQQPLPDPNQLYNQGKQELGDLRELKVGAGSSIFFTDKEGSRWGHPTFTEAKAWIKVDGSAQFKTSAGDVLLSTSALDGNFINVINTALNTASKTILTDFTFESTDYAGAFKAGNPTWDEVTGLITGGSGVLINARGILGANAGVATFTLDATTGNATFAGTLAAPNGTLGTITSGTITGATVQTSATGFRTKLSTVGLQFLSNNDAKGSIGTDSGGGVVYVSETNHYFRNETEELARITSAELQIPNGSYFTIAAGVRMRYTGGFYKIEGGSGGAVGVKVEGSIVPNTDSDYDLGSSGLRWRSLHADDVNINSNAIFGGNTGQTKSTHKYITDCYWEGSSLKVKERYLAFTKGGLTSISGESTRTVHTF